MEHAAWSMHEPACMLVLQQQQHILNLVHDTIKFIMQQQLLLQKLLRACVRCVRGCLRDENRTRLPLAVTSFQTGQIA